MGLILVTGSVTTNTTSHEAAMRLSLEHVHRSRAEPGCLSHDLHLDVENPLRLVFLERWEDRAALDTHFAVPASREFAAAIAPLAAEPPSMAIYEVR